MKVTIFGVIWILFLIFAFLRRGYNNIVVLLFLSAVFQSNSVIVLGDTKGIGPLIITSITFILTVILKQRNISYIKYNKVILGLVTMFLIIILSVIVNDKMISTDKLTYMIQLLLYIVSFIVLYNIRNTLDRKIIKKAIIRIIIFVMSFAIIQLLITGGLLPKFKVVSDLFYNEEWNQSIAYYSATKFRLYSTFMEPSYCGAFLVGSFFYILCERFNSNNKKNVLLLICGIEVILTQSSTAYVSIIIVSIIFLINSKHNKYAKYMIPIGIVVCIIMPLCGDLLDTVLFNKLQSGSAAERSLWNTKALDSFYTSMLIGIGYKNLRASSILYSLLGELGILGFAAYFLTMFMSIKIIFKRRFKDSILSGKYFLLSVVIAQIIACPDLEFSVLWFAMYLTVIDSIQISKYRTVLKQ